MIEIHHLVLICGASFLILHNSSIDLILWLTQLPSNGVIYCNTLYSALSNYAYIDCYNNGYDFTNHKRIRNILALGPHFWFECRAICRCWRLICYNSPLNDDWKHKEKQKITFYGKTSTDWKPSRVQIWCGVDSYLLHHSTETERVTLLKAHQHAIGAWTLDLNLLHWLYWDTCFWKVAEPPNT